ncbi:MAG: hypothetical protein K0S25_628 [Bacillus sp. (in: firmicutes)]|nr:hypothetical protein [Bacillus sp. (in: firmicutes)]
MKKSKWSSYFWKILWVGGFIIFVEISSDLNSQIQLTANETYNLLPVLWFNLFSSIAFGLYISILFVKKWSFKINFPLLLCVSIPCILLSFAYPILATLSSFESLPENIANSTISFWLLKIFSSDVVGIIAGLTIILSVFDVQLKSENH